jgi:hypothetical protein
LKKDKEHLFEVMGEIDRGVQNIFSVLESRGLLDNTMIILVNDNGFLYGEHQLWGKQDPREPSASVPMFIRYPAWFAPNTTVCNNMIGLHDICPTILEAAGIDPAPYNFQGKSIHTLLQPGQERTALYLESIKNHAEVTGPSWRAVRSVGFKYARYRCTAGIEELFDLVTDPEENSNLVNNPAYADTLNTMRGLLDSLAIATVDTFSRDTFTVACSLISTADCPQSCNVSATTKVTNISGEGSCNDGKIKITPSGTFNSVLHLELYNNEDALLSSVDQESTTSPYTFKNLNSGTYHVKEFDGSCCEFDLNDLEVKCPKPTGLFTSKIKNTSATVHWTNQGCNEGYKMQYRKQGESSWTTIKPAIDVSSYHITGLSANTGYEWRVAAACALADPSTNSKYSSIQTFTTSLRLSESEDAGNPEVLLLYPNPAGEMITVELIEGDAELIQLEDPSGRILMSEKITDESSKHILNVASLPAGIYLVTVKTSAGVLKKSFVK